MDYYQRKAEQMKQHEKVLLKMRNRTRAFNAFKRAHGRSPTFDEITALVKKADNDFKLLKS